LKTPVAEDTSTAVGKAATAETLAIAGTSGTNNICKNTSTTGPTATQETTGTAGDTNNKREATTGANITRTRVFNNCRDTTAENPGRLTAERTI
jgi:hypothetical protein